MQVFSDILTRVPKKCQHFVWLQKKSLLNSLCKCYMKTAGTELQQFSRYEIFMNFNDSHHDFPSNVLNVLINRMMEWKFFLLKFLKKVSTSKKENKTYFEEALNESDYNYGFDAQLSVQFKFLF